MKCMLLLAGGILFTTTALGESETLKFTGVLQDQGKTTVALTATDTGESKWVEVGGNFLGYEIISYDAKTSSLVVKKDQVESVIALAEAKIQTAIPKITLAQREAIQHNLKMLRAAAGQFFLETASSKASAADLVGESKYIKKLDPIAGESYSEIVFIPTTNYMAVHTATGETVSLGPVEYVVKAGDTGKKIAGANNISIADLKSLNPDVNWAKLKVGDKLRLHAE